jgi:Holliday junction resolvase
MMVKDFLDKHEFLKMYTYYDSRAPCTDINRRPDFIYLVSETHVICIEVDEDAHRYYNRDCEIARVSEIMQAFGGKPVFLIRFNPRVSLLEELKSTFDAFRTAVITPETSMLTVAFIGYKREYDVAAEMERVAKERAAAAEAEAIELEEEMV